MMGRRCADPERDLVSAIGGNGGDICRAPRRERRSAEALEPLADAFAPFTGSDEVDVTGGNSGFWTDNILDVVWERALSSPSIISSSSSCIAPSASCEGTISGLVSAPFASSQASPSRSSTSASRSCLARQFGHKNCGQDLGSLSIGRIHLKCQTWEQGATKSDWQGYTAVSGDFGVVESVSCKHLQRLTSNILSTRRNVMMLYPNPSSVAFPDHEVACESSRYLCISKVWGTILGQSAYL